MRFTTDTPDASQGLAQLLQPSLILLRGAGGVGKSSVGDLLEQRIEDSVHVDVDDLKVQARDYLSNEQKRMLGRGSANLYLEAALGQQLPVIMSECFIDEYLDDVRSRAERAGYDTHSFYIQSSLEDCLDRNRSRDKTLPDEHIINRYHVAGPNAEDVVVENSPGNLGKAADDILSYVSSTYKINAA